MRKKGHVSLTTVPAVLCTALILCTALLGGASEVQAAGCATYRAFYDINEAWREGHITTRELVLAKAKALYEERSAVDPTCSGEVLNDLKHEVLEDVYRLSDELNQSDRFYLISLHVDLAEALDREAGGFEEAQHKASVGAQSAFNRIAKALDEGSIGLKESVLLRAKLLYAPQLVPRESEFAPGPGEATGEVCGTGFYKDVHRVKDLLNQDEKALLRSLSPDFDAIARSWEGANTALPNYQLDQTTEGKNCEVHYTLTGTNAVPGPGYAVQVAKYIDKAITAETKNFRAAYAEGGGKLQVYCIDMGQDTDGQWKDASDVAGSGHRKSGYMLISSTLFSRWGTQQWIYKLTAVAFHEYFHGVQSAYNSASDHWFQEATAVWAECYYGGAWKVLSGYFDNPLSIFHVPNQNIWLTTDRMYSTSALAFHFSDKYGGYKFIRAYLENSETQNDAILNLMGVLSTQKGAPTFASEYKEFLVRLYGKKITSIAKYMLDVALEATQSNYGVPLTGGSVYLLGACFYKLQAPASATLKQAPLIAILQTTSQPVGNPEGVLAAKNATKPAAVQNGRSYLAKAQEAVFIATDVTYTTPQDTSLRPYQYSVVIPYVKIDSVTADSPIQPGGTSYMNITYDLMGTVAGQTFQGTFKVVEKGADVNDAASGDYDLSIGTKMDFPLYFYAALDAHGTYKFTFQFSVPVDSWGIPQVKSKATCSVVVKQPAASAPLRSGKGATQGSALGIAR